MVSLLTNLRPAFQLCRPRGDRRALILPSVTVLILPFTSSYDLCDFCTGFQKALTTVTLQREADGVRYQPTLRRPVGVECLPCRGVTRATPALETAVLRELADTEEG